MKLVRWDGPLNLDVRRYAAHDRVLLHPGELVQGRSGAWRRDPQFRTLLVLVFFTLLSGTIFYTLEEGWSKVDAPYFSVTTLTTVGLGDLTPSITLGKLFTIIYIFAGLSLILSFVDTIAKETFSSRDETTGQRSRPRGYPWRLGVPTS